MDRLMKGKEKYTYIITFNNERTKKFYSYSGNIDEVARATYQVYGKETIKSVERA